MPKLSATIANGRATNTKGSANSQRCQFVTLHGASTGMDPQPKSQHP
ncbi:hypothetical protein [Bacillus salipaludis]|uniref:Uncharacterized protein n=1 Tax=Bacillus salipaludis TaxID=2547811 RepID=A0ABW8RD26_9BACI